jgi:hypothetical protein
MQRLSYLLCLVLLSAITGCGGSNTTTTNVGLFGNWNVAMYPSGNPNPVYVFALAMSQEGTSYSGASITYNGSVGIPSNMCLDPNDLQVTATTTDGDYNMTITDPSTNTTISVTGTLPSGTTTVSGNYTNAASRGCPASQGSMTMVPQ